MTKLFPLDVESLKKLGGHKFLKQNFIWPTNEKIFHNIVIKFFNNFIKESMLQDKMKKKIFYADYGFAFHITQIAHIILTKKILKKANIRPFQSYDTISILSKNSDLKNPFLLKRKNFLIKTIFLLKKILINTFLKKNFYFNAPTFIDYGSTSSAKIKYAKINKINLVKKYDNDFFNFKNKKKNYNFYFKIVKKLINNFENEINKKFKVDISLNYLVNIWAERLSYADNAATVISKKKNNFSGALFENTSLLKTRIISTIFQNQKKESIGFDHGHTAHPINYIYTAFDPISFNKFITISNKTKNSILKSVRYYFKKFEIKIEYFHFNMNIKKNYLKNKLLAPPKKIKKIMLMGWPLNYRKYYTGAGHFFYNKLIFEFELIKILKKNNFYVIYKAHPDRPTQIISLFKDVVDEIIFEKFESDHVQNMADAYFYSYIGTSTFVTAICSNKHVFLLDDLNYYRSDHLKLLKKRINLVDCKFNRKFKIDEKKLIKKINNLDKKINYEYIDQYLF